MPARLPDIPERMNAATFFVDDNITQGRGDQVAIHYGDQTYTYAQVADGVNRAGNMLRNEGIEIEDRVIILMSDRPEFVETYVGSMKIGAVPVPVDVGQERRPPGPPSRDHVAGAGLGLLDVDVRVEGHAEQVVGRVAGGEGGGAGAPVVGDPDLVHDPAVDPQRPQPLGDEHPGFHGAAGGSGPTTTTGGR